MLLWFMEEEVMKAIILLIAIILSSCVTLKPVKTNDSNYSEGTVNLTIMEW